ncbi:hypothetical protein LL14B4_12905 (plasmid) [Lactococcus lactis subsp. lactis]|uniref:Uncharacterized protein n=1 Tax=Lactococcus lactis subsp. lactis TaxID=1360 RepID=A0A2Z3KT89_LACLL|nr:hypothetical protein [Lactococcus lactis]AWN67099.1 hypothetical protein LL14B4_12905 [Lactococcus lactis subsp. lactis]
MELKNCPHYFIWVISICVGLIATWNINPEHWNRLTAFRIIIIVTMVAIVAFIGFVFVDNFGIVLNFIKQIFQKYKLKEKG